MLKAAAKFTIMFERNKTAMLDVTDDNAERPWDHQYAYSLHITLCNINHHSDVSAVCVSAVN